MTHMLYVVLHGKGMVEESTNFLGYNGSRHGHVTQLNARHINVVLNTRQTYQNSVNFVGVYFEFVRDHPVLYSDNICLQTHHSRIRVFI